MSAALQFPTIAAAAAQRRWQTTEQFQAHPEIKAHAPHQATPQTGFGPARQLPGSPSPDSQAHQAAQQPASRPALPPNLAFYRKHTETLLRRYLYASILVARAPSMLTKPSERGWSSNRPVKTFEDCVIFVLDMEKGLSRVSALDRLLITRIVLQEYSVAETALMLNKSHRMIGLRLCDALDRLTGILLEHGTLKIPTRGGRQLLDVDLDD
jgi:hypothetical protein